MRTAKRIRYRLEWLGLKFATKLVPLLSRKACYRLALLLGAMLDRRNGLSNVEAIKVHDLVPRRYKVVHKFFLTVRAAVNFG